MAMLDIVGQQLAGMTAYNEYITDVIISVIVYLSAFSLVIQMLISSRQKKDDGPNANAEPAAAAITTEETAAPAAEDETKGGEAE